MRPDHELHALDDARARSATQPGAGAPGASAGTHAERRELEQTRNRLNRAVWGVAVGVMTYGAINVTSLLMRHGVSPFVAWVLSVMIDLGMCVGLWGERVLHHYNRRDTWVTSLRWVTAVMTLTLNTARPALERDLVGVGIHAVGPILLLVVAEAAGSIQRQLTEIVRELQPAPLVRDPNSETRPEVSDVTRSAVASRATAPDTARDRDTDGQQTQRHAETSVAAHCSERVSSRPPGSGTTGENPRRRERPPRNEPPQTSQPRRHVPRSERDDAGFATASRGTRTTRRDASIRSRSSREDETLSTATGDTAKEVMWRYWLHCRDVGETPNGAELDAVAGTNNYGRSVLRGWLKSGKITQAEHDATRTMRRRRHRPASPVPAKAA